MAIRSRPRWCSAAITGAGSGLGREIALALAAKGCIVFGTAASAEEVHEMRTASCGRASLAVCDPGRFDVVQVWASGVADALDGAGLELLIHVPASMAPMPLEALSGDNLRHGFEGNVLGAVSAINAFLPALRKAQGRIVQISDWTASLPLPFDGVSAASLAALEALASAYRAELERSGVAVTVATVGRLKSAGPAPAPGKLRRVATGMTAEQRALYGAQLRLVREHTGERRPSAVDLAETAARIIDAAEQVPAPLRVAIGSEAKLMLRAARERSDEELGALRLQLAGLR